MVRHTAATVELGLHRPPSISVVSCRGGSTPPPLFQVGQVVLWCTLGAWQGVACMACAMRIQAALWRALSHHPSELLNDALHGALHHAIAPQQQQPLHAGSAWAESADWSTAHAAGAVVGTRRAPPGSVVRVEPARHALDRLALRDVDASSAFPLGEAALVGRGPSLMTHFKFCNLANITIQFFSTKNY